MTSPRTIKGTIKATKEYYARVEQAKEKREQAERELKALDNKNWLDLMVRPLAKQIAKHFPNREVEILGPFGLGSRVSVWFKMKGVSEKKIHDKKGGIKAITFQPGELDKGELYVVNEKEDNGSCPKGSIGQINGFNHPTMVITPNMTIKDLLKYVY